MKLIKLINHQKTIINIVMIRVNYKEEKQDESEYNSEDNYEEEFIDDLIDTFNEDNKETKGKYLPAIVAFARNADGKVTGGQQILLNKNSGTKADIAIPKKSFGKICVGLECIIDGGIVDNLNVEFILLQTKLKDLSKFERDFKRKKKKKV